jgi:hypothetical protein
MIVIESSFVVVAIISEYGVEKRVEIVAFMQAFSIGYFLFSYLFGEYGGLNFLLTDGTAGCLAHGM